ncbi:MAG: tetraacyldisaccharide 4'-kinase [Gemmatimonadaceae bacterium]|nr:tetraacyldisaccharide 4'-kinase [Gemmatimonadaceae bacterium]
MRESLVRRVWYGTGYDALLARAVLTPAEWAYGAVSLVAGAQRARGAGQSIVPTISVGNITVGGTGKTPIAAWVAGQLLERGHHPALLLRGYGGDEPLVHALLNPNVPVHTNPDRRRAALRAVADGATALVLDDGFQHRQMPRDADIVLVSADLWHDLPVRLLPAGPFREPLEALRRASLVVVTRKAASAERAAHVATLVQRAAPQVGVAVAYLAPDTLRRWDGAGVAQAAALSGERVLAVSGIGAPEAFAAQLRALGAEVEATPYGDHHDFSASDITALVAGAARADRVVCTLKDAVKLGPRWPAGAPPLWYLSQTVVLETGAAALPALLDRVVGR